MTEDLKSTISGPGLPDERVGSLTTLAAGSNVGKYQIVAVLGQGGFGITYRARDTQLDRDVALKEYMPTGFAVREPDSMVLPRSTHVAEDFRWGRDRFLDEAKTLARLTDAPGVVDVFDYLEANGTGYMVMALVEGETLEERLNRDRRLQQPAIERLLYPLLDGLELVHAAGFLHRDIKPANILLDASGLPTLIDFGASRAALLGRTKAMTAIYTPGYAAPEQMTSAKQGPWTDIYAVAGTLYHCVTGRPPPGAMDRVTGDPLVPAAEAGKGRYAPSLLAAIDAGLSLKAADRPPSIAEWRQVLSGIGASHGRETPGTPTREMDELATRRVIESTTAAGRRSALPWIAAGALALIIAGGGAWIALRSPPLTAEQALRRAEEEGQRQMALAAKLRQEQEAATEARRQAEATLARKQAEEKAATDEAARRQTADTERQRAAASEARRQAEAELARKTAEEKTAAEATARRKAEEDARARTEAEAAQRRRDDEIRREVEARVRAEMEAQRRAENDARRLVDDKSKAEAAARLKAEQEARATADAEAVARRREDEARRTAEAQAKVDAAARENAGAEAKRKTEDEARRTADEKVKTDADAKRQAEAGEAALRLPEQERKRVQVALTALGHDTRGTDGTFGPRTRQMIASWQKGQRAPETGYLDAAQLAALRQQAAPALARYDEAQKKAEDEAKRQQEDDARKRAEEAQRRTQQPQAAAAPAATAPPAVDAAGVDGRWTGALQCDAMLPRDDPVALNISNGRAAYRRNPLELTLEVRGERVTISVVSATDRGFTASGELSGRVTGGVIDTVGGVRHPSNAMLGSARCTLRLTKQ